MKRLYISVVIVRVGNITNIGKYFFVGNSQDEVTGKILNFTKNQYPSGVIEKFDVHKISMNDFFEIFEELDFNEAQADFIRKTLQEKGL